MAQRETELLNAYLIVGNDELKVAALIKRLWSRLEKDGNLDFNSQILDGTKSINERELLDSLNTPPLAAPHRIVLIKDVDKASKDLRDALADYLASPMPTTILMMSATKLDKPTRLYKAVNAISSKAVIDASVMKKSELPAMIRKLANSYQISLTFDGAVKLNELVGSSTVALNTQVEKLAAYVSALGKSEANLEDVLTVVTRTNQPSPWDFVDAISRRDLISSLEILNMLQKEQPSSLLYLCVTRMRELLQYKALVKRQDGRIAQEMGKKDWQLKRLEQVSRLFSDVELRKLMSVAADADARMKSGEDQRLCLEEYIFAACG